MKIEILARGAQPATAMEKLERQKHPSWNQGEVSTRVSHLRKAVYMRGMDTACRPNRRIQAVEMRSLRRLLGISYKDHVTYNEVHRRVTPKVRHYEDLLTTVKKRKLRWYRQVTRSERLTKTIPQGTVQEKRRRGKKERSWADSILEWTG